MREYNSCMANGFTAKKYYIAGVAVLGLVCHTFGLEYLYFTAAALLAVYVALTDGNGLRLLPPALAGMTVPSRINNNYYGDRLFFSGSAGGAAYLCVLGTVTAAALAVIVVRSVRKNGFSAKRYKLLPGLIALTAAITAGGLFFSGYNALSFFIALYYLAVILGLYLFLAVTIEWDAKSFGYICDTAVAVVAVIAAQVGILYATNASLRAGFDKNLIVFGWTISNCAAILIAVYLPLVLYRMITAKQPLTYFVIALAGVVAVVYTLCRSAALIALPMYLAVSAYALVKGRNAKTLRIAYIIAAVIGAAALILLRGQIADSLRFFSETGLNDRGRFSLYRLALQNWRRAPVFGTGFGYMRDKSVSGFGWLLYHNYILQLLASTGIAGLIAYGYHRLQTVKLLIKNFNLINVFIFLSIIMFMAASLLDVILFSPFTAIYPLMLIALERNIKYKEQLNDSTAKNIIPNSSRGG